MACTGKERHDSDKPPSDPSRNQLQCLSRICALLARDQPLSGTLQEVVRILPTGWQRPETVHIRVELDDLDVQSGQFHETAACLQEPILTVKGRVGLIQVSRLQGGPDRDDVPFSLQERELLACVAMHLGQAVERNTHRGLSAPEPAPGPAPESTTDHQHLITILNAIEAIIYLADLRTGRLLFINEHLRQLAGDVLGQKCWQAIHPGQGGPCAHCTNHKLLDHADKPTGRHFLEFRNERTRRWYACQSQAVPWIDGRMVRMSFAVDITDRKHAEQALLTSENRFALAMEAARDGIWDWDISTDMVYYSPGYAAMLGYDSTQTPGHVQSWLDLIHPEDRAMALRINQECIENLREDFQVEFRMQAKNGDWRWILGRGKAVRRDESGRATRLVGTHADITRLKQSELDLRIKDQAMAASLDAMALVNLEGRLTYVNRACLELWGYEHEADVLGRPVVDFWENAQDVDKVMRNVLAQGRAVAETVAHRKDGELVHIRLRVNLIWDEQGRPKAMLGLMRDVTQHRKHQRELVRAKRQAEAATQAKSEFLANMSHEIRTPMNGVIGMTELLLDTDLDKEQAVYVQNIQASGEALMCLLNDILDFSKIEAGRLELEEMDFDLQHLLDDFATMMAVRAHEKQLELICYMEPDVPELVRGDPTRLRQILINLVSNAVKFTEYGSVVVSVALVQPLNMNADQALEQETVKLCFTVRDTGIGIPPDRIDLIFNKFSQVDASTSRKFGGTGLGLAISMQLAEMMGGEIGVNSVFGKGSEFWFTAALTARRQESVLSAHMSILEGRHVLVVEGNALNREILVTQLTKRGMECLAVENAIAALTALNAGYEWDQMFDLVILDMDMPGMDGVNLARSIKTDTRHAHIPLVMLTSMGRPGEARKCAAIGFAGYLNKPVRQSELYDTLALVLHQLENPSLGKDIITRHIVQESELSRIRQEQFTGHVLVVEDNPVNQQVAVGILGKFGLSADVAADGAKALHCLEQSRYDLVLMDVHMPGMDGLAATREIRRLKSGNAGIPIIAMTAGAMPQDRKQCREAGMDDYIAKPVNPALLARVLGTWLPGLRTARWEAADAPPEPKMDACPPTQEPPVFDARELRRRCMGDQVLVRDIFDIFQNSLAERLETLRQAMDREDRPALVQIAHAVKGSAINAACPALAQAAAKLEQACQALDSPIDPKLVQKVEQEIERVVQVVCF